MFIQTETTPNPAVLKFLPGRELLAAGTREFRDAGEADASPLAMFFASSAAPLLAWSRSFLTVAPSLPAGRAPFG